MAFDGVFLHYMQKELADNIIDSKITKIHQISNKEIVFYLRKNKENLKLLISAMPESSRIQLTNDTYEKPAFPPTFNVFLKKHLLNGRIKDIYQHENDRIITFEIETLTIIKDVTTIKIVVELFGKNSNIIILNNENIILESLTHIPPFSNTERTIYPNVTYSYPKQDKENPFFTTKQLVFDSPKDIVKNMQGISPQLAMFIFDSNLDIKTFFDNLSIAPNIFVKNNKSHYSLVQHPNSKEYFDSLSELLDYYHSKKEHTLRIKQKSRDVEMIIKRELDRNHKKISKLESELEQAKNNEQYKKYADLIYANIHQVTKGASEVILPDLFSDGSPIKIILDGQKSPIENANYYYTKFKKSKNAVTHINKQIDNAKKEVEYFQLLKDQLDFATYNDVLEMRDELILSGYIRKRSNDIIKKNSKHKPSFERYITTDGFDILVGKNNIQNEYLTHKEGDRLHYWFHVKDLPGSHVIIKSKETLSEEAIRTAAMLAAYHSKARYSSSVPVDYTQIRNIKSIPGKKKCFVTYTKYKTIYIDPDEEIIQNLNKKP